MKHNTVKRHRPLMHYRSGESEIVQVAGRDIILDACDFGLLDGWTIGITPKGYAMLVGTAAEFPRFRVQLARLIMNALPGTIVDHINQNTLDNRRSNLRICTDAENQHNRKRNKTSPSPFKGVTHMKTQRGSKKWLARIQLNKVPLRIGCFLTAEEAALAYNAKARELFGEFARINVMDRPNETVSVL